MPTTPAFDWSLQYDATNSWSGYNYQGKVAIYVVIQKINELFASNNANLISNYYLELEWLEDFSILHDMTGTMQYDSIHQVKARADTSIESYAQALTQLVRKVQADRNISYAYLHTVHPVTYNAGTWTESVEAVLTTEDALQALIKEADAHMHDHELLTDLVAEIRRQGGKTNFVVALKREYLTAHPGQKLVKATATPASVTEALSLLRASLQSDLDHCRNGIPSTDLQKIQMYGYGANGQMCCTLDQIDTLIKEELVRYWGNNVADAWKTLDPEFIEQIWLCLMGKIDKHITERHMDYGRMPNRRIPFICFMKAMNSDAAFRRCEEYYLYESKHIILCHCKEYCIRCLRANGSNAPCNSCQIVNAVEHIESLSFDDLKEFLHVTNPDVQKKHDVKSMSDYCAPSKYYNPFLGGLYSILQPFDPLRVPISFISQKRRLYLLTTLNDDGAGLPLETVCQNILRNTLPEVFMDYDVLLSKDLTTRASILEDAGDFMGKMHLDENNIYHFKDVKIQPVSDSLSEFDDKTGRAI